MLANHNSIPEDFPSPDYEGVLSANSVECKRCPAACCRAGVGLELSESERKTLEEAGTVLREVMSPDLVAKRSLLGLGRKKQVQIPGCYQFVSDCAFLVGNQCAKFGDPQRPEACSAMPRGGPACVTIQRRQVALGKDYFA